jgi:ElaB/YqjD/DUF883 family membrane-anchored ribosome-binding protein
VTSKTKTSETNGATPELSLEQIQAQFDTLRTNLSDFAATLMALGVETTESTIAAGVDRVGNASTASRAKASPADESLGRRLDEMLEVVRGQPFRAFAISAALGVAFGYLVARRR